MRFGQSWHSEKTGASGGLSLRTWLGKGVAPSTCSEGAIVLPRSDILLCEDEVVRYSCASYEEVLHMNVLLPVRAP